MVLAFVSRDTQQMKMLVAATMMTSLPAKLLIEVHMITGTNKITAMRGLRSPRATLIVEDWENM
jgi:hypothetical protein